MGAIGTSLGQAKSYTETVTNGAGISAALSGNLSGGYIEVSGTRHDLTFLGGECGSYDVAVMEDGNFLVVWAYGGGSSYASSHGVVSAMVIAPDGTIARSAATLYNLKEEYRIFDAAIVIETSGDIHVTLTSTDIYWRVASGDFQIAQAPAITNPQDDGIVTASMVENTRSAIDIDATDPDPGASLTYAISGGADAALFDIDASTGALTFKSAPDFEAPADSDHDNVYVLSVTASDGALSDRQTIEVTVTDVVTTLTGTSGADSLSALAGEEYTISGLGGNDTLTGGAGADTLDGGEGDDWLIGGAGADSLIGGTGNDTYQVTDSAAVVTELADGGLDTVRAYVSHTLADNVEWLWLSGTLAINGTGNAGNNILYGNSGNNRLSGGAGDDYLHGFGGQDTLVGGAGDDRYFVNSADDVVIEAADEGLDEVRSILSWTLSAHVENLLLLGPLDINGAGPTDISGTGNALGNTLTGNVGNNALSGLDGSDMLIGMAGNDTLLGGDGADTLDGGTGSDSMIGGLGNDVYVVDSAGDKVIELSGGGTDRVETTLAAYSIAKLTYVENVTYTGTGAALLTGNTAANVLVGGAGNDTLVGGNGNDTLDGGDGDDTFNLGTKSGVDAFIGGAGYDRVVASAANATVQYSLLSGIEEISGGGFAGVKVLGTSAANTIDLSALTLTGLAGIDGGSGNDTLIGSAGADTLIGGAGNDSMDGGEGDDTFQIGASSGTDAFIGGAGHDAIVATAANAKIAWSQLSDIEAISGGGFAGVKIVGTSAANTFDFSGIALTGLAGIDGGAGNDTIIGSAGADTLIGGTGRDTMTGGAGADTFLYTLSSQSGRTTSDRITDFAHGEDRIDLSAIDGDGSAGLANAFSWIGTAAFSGVAGQLRYAQVGGDTVVYGDTNGDRAADIQITLTGLLTLDAGDFWL